MGHYPKFRRCAGRDMYKVLTKPAIEIFRLGFADVLEPPIRLRTAADVQGVQIAATGRSFYLIGVTFFPYAPVNLTSAPDFPSNTIRLVIYHLFGRISYLINIAVFFQMLNAAPDQTLKCCVLCKLHHVGHVFAHPSRLRRPQNHCCSSTVVPQIFQFLGFWTSVFDVMRFTETRMNKGDPSSWRTIAQFSRSCSSFPNPRFRNRWGKPRGASCRVFSAKCQLNTNHPAGAPVNRLLPRPLKVEQNFTDV